MKGNVLTVDITDHHGQETATRYHQALLYKNPKVSDSADNISVLYCKLDIADHHGQETATRYHQALLYKNPKVSDC